MLPTDPKSASAKALSGSQKKSKAAALDPMLLSWGIEVPASDNNPTSAAQSTTKKKAGGKASKGRSLDDMIVGFGFGNSQSTSTSASSSTPYSSSDASATLEDKNLGVSDTLAQALAAVEIPDPEAYDPSSQLVSSSTSASEAGASTSVTGDVQSLFLPTSKLIKQDPVEELQATIQKSLVSFNDKVYSSRLQAIRSIEKVLVAVVGPGPAVDSATIVPDECLAGDKAQARRYYTEQKRVADSQADADDHVDSGAIALSDSGSSRGWSHSGKRRLCRWAWAPIDDGQTTARDFERKMRMKLVAVEGAEEEEEAVLDDAERDGLDDDEHALLQAIARGDKVELTDYEEHRLMQKAMQKSMSLAKRDLRKEAEEATISFVNKLTLASKTTESSTSSTSTTTPLLTDKSSPSSLLPHSKSASLRRARTRSRSPPLSPEVLSLLHGLVKPLLKRLGDSSEVVRATAITTLCNVLCALPASVKGGDSSWAKYQRAYRVVDGTAGVQGMNPEAAYSDNDDDNDDDDNSDDNRNASRSKDAEVDSDDEPDPSITTSSSSSSSSSVTPSYRSLNASYGISSLLPFLIPVLALRLIDPKASLDNPVAEEGSGRGGRGAQEPDYQGDEEANGTGAGAGGGGEVNDQAAKVLEAKAVLRGGGGVLSREPSDILRENLIALLAIIIQRCAQQELQMYLYDLCLIARSAIGDSSTSVVVLAAIRLVIPLLRLFPHTIKPASPAMLVALLPALNHKHARVRLAALCAVELLVQCGSSDLLRHLAGFKEGNVIVIKEFYEVCLSVLMLSCCVHVSFFPHPPSHALLHPIRFISPHSISLHPLVLSSPGCCPH